jgi:hypothetical protein
MLIHGVMGKACINKHVAYIYADLRTAQAKLAFVHTYICRPHTAA